jgi:molybdate transport system substrate-binding protein
MMPFSAIPTLAIAAVLALAGCNRSAAPHNDTLTVSVAASLQNAMAELAPTFEHSQPGVKLAFNFGASGTLEQQIERGAPADVFFSAAPKPMDTLASKGLILADTRRDLLRNRVVLIAPKDGPGPASFRELTDQKVKLLALGDPASVPAGDYGRQTLQALELWSAVQSKLVLGKDVRQVLTYVETRNADAGIVYATDAQESDKVRVVDTAPDGSHTPVLYPIAVIRESHNIAAARALVAFLAGRDAGAVFAKHGFTMVSQ